MTEILLKIMTLNTITLKCSFNHMPCVDRVVQLKHVIVSSHALITAIVYILSNTELSNKNAFHNFPFYKQQLFHFITFVFVFQVSMV